jgi:hypothetical protein
MKYRLLIVVYLTLCSQAFASYQNPIQDFVTTGQKFNYVVTVLNQYFIPMGYTLDVDSIDISEKVYVTGMTTESIIATRDYNVNHVGFTVAQNGTNNEYHGHIYLVTALKNAKKNLNIPSFNQTAKVLTQISSKNSNEEFSLVLSKDWDSRSFVVDLSPLDFQLSKIQSIDDFLNRAHR